MLKRGCLRSRSIVGQLRINELPVLVKENTCLQLGVELWLFRQGSEEDSGYSNCDKDGKERDEEAADQAGETLCKIDAPRLAGATKEAWDGKETGDGEEDIDASRDLAGSDDVEEDDKEDCESSNAVQLRPE